MKKDLKYNLIIYSSLLFAVICMFMAVKGYYDSLEKKESFHSEIKEAIKEINTENEEVIDHIEPENMTGVDKSVIINNAFNNIIERKLETRLLTRDMVLTWNSYEISDIEYIRQIADNYYCYKANIIIFNVDANIPITPVNNPEDDEFIVISLYFNINYNDQNNEYSVKTIEIPNR